MMGAGVAVGHSHPQPQADHKPLLINFLSFWQDHQANQSLWFAQTPSNSPSALSDTLPNQAKPATKCGNSQTTSACHGPQDTKIGEAANQQVGPNTLVHHQETKQCPLGTTAGMPGNTMDKTHSTQNSKQKIQTHHGQLNLQHLILQGKSLGPAVAAFLLAGCTISSLQQQQQAGPRMLQCLFCCKRICNSSRSDLLRGSLLECVLPAQKNCAGFLAAFAMVQHPVAVCWWWCRCVLAKIVGSKKEGMQRAQASGFLSGGTFLEPLGGLFGNRESLQEGLLCALVVGTKGGGAGVDSRMKSWKGRVAKEQHLGFQRGPPP